MKEVIQNLLLSCVPAIITGIIAYISSCKSAKSDLSKLKEENLHDIEKLKEQNSHDIDKLMKQHVIDIDALKEQHKLELEKSEKEHQHKLEYMQKEQENKMFADFAVGLMENEKMQNMIAGKIMNSIKWKLLVIFYMNLY